MMLVRMNFFLKYEQISHFLKIFVQFASILMRTNSKKTIGIKDFFWTAGTCLGNEPYYIGWATRNRWHSRIGIEVNRIIIFPAMKIASKWTISWIIHGPMYPVQIKCLPFARRKSVSWIPIFWCLIKRIKRIKRMLDEIS